MFEGFTHCKIALSDAVLNVRYGGSGPLFCSCMVIRERMPHGQKSHPNLLPFLQLCVLISGVLVSLLNHLIYLTTPVHQNALKQRTVSN